GPHARSTADPGALEGLICRPAAHRVVVRGDHARRDERMLLDDCVRGQVAVRLDAGSGADLDVVVDAAPAADHRARADAGPLTDLRLVPDDRSLAQLDPGVHDGS